MRSYKLWTTFGTMVGFFLLCQVWSHAASSPANYWRFKAVTRDAISSSSDPFDGEYEVVASGENLEVFQLLEGQRVAVRLDHAAELKRMIGRGQDERQYLKFPIEKKWSKSHSYNTPAVRGLLQRTVEYQLIGEEEITTAAGTFKTFKIEGDAPGRSGTFFVKWIYYYSSEIDAIVRFHYDSGVDRKGAKLDIELIKFGASSKD